MANLVSGAVIEIISDRPPKHRRTGTPDGRFLLRFWSDEKQRPPIRVSSRDGELVHIIPPAEPAVRRVLRIFLRPPREVGVHVTNSPGAFAAGAYVAAVIGHIPIVFEQTAIGGFATLSRPAHASVDWIVACQVGQRSEYFESYQCRSWLNWLQLRP